MSDMDITVILDDLSAGRIDAAEAKRRIENMGVGEGHSAPDQPVSTEWPQMPPQPATPPPAAPPTEPPFDLSTPPQGATSSGVPPRADRVNGVKKVLVKATGRKVRIIADSAVSTAAAEDVHQVKRSGGVMEILGDPDMPGVSDVISWVKSIKRFDDIKEDIKGLSVGKELNVRVNPALEVDIDVTGCSLLVTDVAHLGKIRLTAGQATITGAHLVSDLLLQAGQASVDGVFTEGWSRLRCESGQLVVSIGAGSDVVVRADAQLGRINWEGVSAPETELTIGHGIAHLDMGVVIGHGVVKVAA